MNNLHILHLSVFGEHQLRFLVKQKNKLKETNPEQSKIIGEMLMMEGFELKEAEDRTNIYTTKECGEKYNSVEGITNEDYKEVVTCSLYKDELEEKEIEKK